MSQSEQSLVDAYVYMRIHVLISFLDMSKNVKTSEKSSNLLKNAPIRTEYSRRLCMHKNPAHSCFDLILKYVKKCQNF